MDEDVRVLLGPRRSWVRRLWAMVGTRIHPGWNALWLTDDEIVIANQKETHIVPLADATVEIVDHEYSLLPKQEWDNSRTAMRTLYVVPADPDRERVQVQAAEGLTPRKLTAIVEALEAAVEDYA